MMRTTALPGSNDKYNTEHEKKLTKSFFLTGVHNLAGKNVKEAFLFLSSVRIIMILR